jgi:hypothetical protein
MSPAMLTLVAAVDVYDLAAEGATDAFKLLSSPRLSRYAISWTSVEKDIVVMNWRWAVSLLTVELLRPQGHRLQEREKYSQMRLQIAGWFGFNRSRVLSCNVKDGSVATLRWLVCLRQRLGELSDAVRFEFGGVWGPDVVRQIRQVRRLL